MNEFFKSLSEWFEEKTSSPFWYTLLFAFIFWNWQILYTLFFEEIIQETKVHYICKNFFQVNSEFCPLLKWKYKDIIYVYGTPLMIAIVSIWAVPFVSNFVFKQRLKFSTEREEDIFNSNNSISKKLKSKLYNELQAEDHEDHDSYIKSIEMQEQAMEEEQKEREIHERKLWNIEYEKMRTDGLIHHLSNIQNKSNSQHKLFIDLGLIEYQKNGTIIITKKGEFFTNKKEY